MSDNEQHNEIMTEIRAINKKLDPMYEMYTTARNLGSWAKWGLGFLLLAASLYLAIKQIFKS